MKIGPFLLLPAALSTEISSIDEWESGVEQLVAMQRNVPWWLGDMVVQGEARFGDDFWQAVPLNASLSLLERCASVSRKYPPAERFISLSWTHHVIALRVKDPIARRSVLRHAEREQLDGDSFREFITEIFNG